MGLELYNFFLKYDTSSLILFLSHIFCFLEMFPFLQPYFIPCSVKYTGTIIRKINKTL